MLSKSLAWTPPARASQGQSRTAGAVGTPSPHLPEECHHVQGPGGRVRHRGCPEHVGDFVCGSVGPNVIRPLWETPQDKHLDLSAFQTPWEVWLEHRSFTVSLSRGTSLPVWSWLSGKNKMSARTMLITGHLTAGQAGANPRSQSYQPGGICLVFSVFLSY